MFLSERELRDVFWKNYNYNKRAIRYQFEIEFRTGPTDLLTLETFQGHYQLNAFEFKLTDMKKVILQAKGNSPYVHKSWIVVPMEKKELILTKYKGSMERMGVGCIAVETEGRWELIIRPRYRGEVLFNQEIMNFMVEGK